MLKRAGAARVLARHNPGLHGVQPQTVLPQRLGDPAPDEPVWTLPRKCTTAFIVVAFLCNGRVGPGHPRAKCLIHEHLREQRRNLCSLVRFPSSVWRWCCPAVAAGASTYCFSIYQDPLLPGMQIHPPAVPGPRGTVSKNARRSMLMIEVVLRALLAKPVPPHAVPTVPAGNRRNQGEDPGSSVGSSTMETNPSARIRTPVIVPTPSISGSSASFLRRD